LYLPGKLWNKTVWNWTGFDW